MTAWCCCLALTLLGQADVATAEDPAAQVRELVRQLDAADKAARDAAEASLLELGPAALEHLPDPTPRMSAEVKLRLERVRSELLRVRATAAVSPTFVTLAAEQMPLSQVLASIEEQTGNRLMDYRQQFGQQVSDPPVTVAWEQRPFWQAVDELLDRTELTIYPYGEADDALALVNRMEELTRQGAAAYADALRLEPVEMTAYRSLRNPNSQSLEVVVQAAWEPRLKPVLLVQLLDGVQATDDQGQQLQLAGQGTLEVSLEPGVKSSDLVYRFAPPPRTAQTIATFAGQLELLLPGATESFRFENLAQAKRVEQRRGQATVVLDQVRKNNDLYEIRIRVLFEKSEGALESHRDWIYQNVCHLLGSDGPPIEPVAFETTRQAENEVGLAYLFDLPEGVAGLTLEYITPVALVRQPVAFELHDLPLP